MSDPSFDSLQPADMKSDALRQMSFYPNVPNISTGHPIIDQLISLLLGGSNIAPRPIRGQSAYDAYMQRDRSNEFLKAMQGGVMNSPLLAKLGGVSPEFASMAAVLSGGPDGLFDNPLMKAANGGNPIKAQMGLMAGLTGMTQTMGFGASGNISAHDTNALMKKLTETMFKTRQVTDNDLNQVRDRVATDVDKYAEKHQDALKDITTTVNGKSELDYNHLEEIRKHTKDFTENVVGQLSDEAVKSYKEVIRMRKPLQNLESLKNTLVPEKLNWEVTRGFETQDITKSYMMAIDRGLFQAGKYEKKDATGRSDKGIGKWTGAMGVMRATADLTGTETGEDTLSAFSDLFGGVAAGGVGASKIDLGNTKDTSDTEKLLRDFKGAAYAAGVSIEAVLGINREIKALASRYPALQYMGGFGALHTSISSLQQTQALAATLGQGFVREHGGTQTLLQERAEVNVANKDEPIAKQTSALWAYVESRADLSKEEKDQAKDILIARMNGEERYSSDSIDGRGNLNHDLSKILSTNESQIDRTSESEIYAMEGEKMVSRGITHRGKTIDTFGTAAETATMQTFESIVGNVAFQTEAIEGRNSKGELISTMLNKAHPKDNAELIQDLRDSISKRGETGESYAGILGRLNIPITSELARRLDPTTEEGRHYLANLDNGYAKLNPKYQANMIINKELQDSYSKSSTEYSRTYAKVHGGVLANFIQEGLSGSFGQGLNGMIESLSGSPVQERMRVMMDSYKKAREEGTYSSISSALVEQHGGTAMSEQAANEKRETLRKRGWKEEDIEKEIKNDQAPPMEKLKLEGKTEDQAKQLIKQREELTEDNLKDLTEVGKDLTVSQIEKAAIQYKGSKAEELLGADDAAGTKAKRLQQASKTLHAVSGLEWDRISEKFANVKVDKSGLDDIFTRTTMYNAVETQNKGQLKNDQTQLSKDIATLLGGTTDVAFQEINNKFEGADGIVDVEQLQKALLDPKDARLSKEARVKLRDFNFTDSSGNITAPAELKKAVERSQAYTELGSQFKTADGSIDTAAMIRAIEDPNDTSISTKTRKQLGDINDVDTQTGKVVDFEVLSKQVKAMAELPGVRVNARARLLKDKIINDKDELQPQNLEATLSSQHFTPEVYEDLAKKEFKKADGSVDYDKFEKALLDDKDTTISTATKRALSDKGYVDLTPEGKVAGIPDKRKLREDIDSDAAQVDLAELPTQLAQHFKEYIEHINQSKKDMETVDKQGAEATKELAKVLNTLQTTLSSGTTDLVKSAASIVTALAAIIKPT